MYVTSGNHTEIQLTLDAMVEFVNALLDARADSEDSSDDIDQEAARAVLHAQGFSRAATAPAVAVRRVVARAVDLLPRVLSLPGSDVETATTWVNAELTELSVAPSLSTHDGSELHIHWTPSSATFDDQVLADILMAVAQDLCDNGTKRYGKCAAADCEHIFYDSSRNGSRRFCSDPRCASRTHTADHRKRRKKD